jgi:tetratricopeptide (TPR) repeat protein
MKNYLHVKQVFVIFGAVALTIVLYLLPVKSFNKKAEKTIPVQPNKRTSYDFKAAIEKAKLSLDNASLKKINFLEGQLKTVNQDNDVLNKLGTHWDELKNPAIAAHYFEMIAKNNPDEKNWLNAAYRYFDAFKLEQDSSIRNVLIEKAIESYSSVLSINAKNLNAKTDLGICYTETSQPMKGIMLLREVIKEKPEHENAQFNLGLLSMKSRQYDKAVDRFQKVIDINPLNLDAYLYLGEVFEQKGDKEKAIHAFEKYKELSKNKAANKQVDIYIKNLKNN